MHWVPTHLLCSSGHGQVLNSSSKISSSTELLRRNGKAWIVDAFACSRSGSIVSIFNSGSEPYPNPVFKPGLKRGMGKPGLKQWCFTNKPGLNGVSDSNFPNPALYLHWLGCCICLYVNPSPTPAPAFCVAPHPSSYLPIILNT